MTADVTATSIRAGQVLDLAGVATRVWASDPARAAAIAALLREAVPTSDPPSVEFRFEDAPAPSMAWSGDGPFEIRREESGVVFVRSALGLVARVTPDEILVVGDARDLRAALRPVFAFAVAHVFASRGRQVLHAAGLGVDDGCVLVLGPTGAGKSTVALCALRCGWPVLGDDLVVLDVLDGSGEGVFATALPRPIAAPPDVVDDGRAVPVSGDTRERLELPRGTLTSGTRPVLGLIVTTHATSPHSAMHAIRTLAVPTTVLASFLVADDAEMRKTLFPLTMALSRLPAVELAHGTDPDARLDDGAALLEQIRERLSLR